MEKNTYMSMDFGWILGKTKTLISGKAYIHLKILVNILVVYVVKKLEVVQSFESDANIDTQEFQRY